MLKSYRVDKDPVCNLSQQEEVNESLHYVLQARPLSFGKKICN